MYKYSLALALMVFSFTTLADTAVCTIEIQDVNKGSKQNIAYNFSFESGSSEGQRKHFSLSDKSISCTLAFFNLNSGTMLSCQIDELGHNFVQSDRSVIKEGTAKNNLSFRYKSSFYSLESACK